MNDEQPHSDSIEGIISQAAAGEASSTDDLTQDEIKTLADRVDLLTADFGRWESYKAASTEYVTAFTAEIDWHRRIRLSVTIAGVLLMVFFLGCLIVALRKGEQLFGVNQSYALTALVIGCITGCVIVSIALIKGAFSNLADRNAGLPMPDHIKEIVEVGKNLLGK